MAKVDPRDFLLNTDFEMDKIVYFYQEKVTPDAYGYFRIKHKMPFRPLITGAWSKTKDFTSPQPFYFGLFTDPNTNLPPTDIVQCDVDDTYINLTMYTSTGSSTDFFVRLYGFEPSDSRANVGYTSKYANKFILNTDYNYLKLQSTGVLEVQRNQQDEFNAVTITHNLGYHAQALFWQEDAWNTYQIGSMQLPQNIIGDHTIPLQGVASTTNTFVIHPFIPQAPGAIKIHYRIYYDEAI